MNDPTVRLTYDDGTLVVSGIDAELAERVPHLRHDSRTRQYRAEARHYRAIAEFLARQRLHFTDEARKWDKKAAWELHADRDPYPHQTEALDVWWKTGGRGLVVLPTGTGKTFLAMLAIQKAARNAFVVTWTIDLLNQWVDQLARAFRVPIGALGAGNYDIQGITVSTYDSAHLHLSRWGDRFGLLVVDECHHLPGPSYQAIGIGSLAPYRLGLTATPERSDGQESRLVDLVGPTVYRREINELEGDFLAEYRTVKLFVELSDEEMEQYRAARDTYRGFVADRGINMAGPQGWQRFLYETTKSPEGRAAFRAYRESKRLERAAAAKLAKLDELLAQHNGERTLIFTADNATVYAISRRFLVPALTHQTKAKERQKLLARFHSGEYSVLVTSQVLNEGVDVPAASVGIVLSGTGTVRENVQRLGRILRRYGDKQATLYEVVARGTAEEFTSERRRQHTAFRG